MEIDKLIPFIPFLIPLLIIELGLVIFVIADIIKKKKTKNLNPLIWIAISVLLMSTFIGPVLYIIFGRAEAEITDDNNNDNDDDI
ncbi:MAG: PLDc N-terminal domain-containing protein [Oscillospiraceae bacterium]|nr:PLDc N-terminal domain-containing protein [Oscillospiraceae bacterium]